MGKNELAHSNHEDFVEIDSIDGGLSLYFALCWQCSGLFPLEFPQNFLQTF